MNNLRNTTLIAACLAFSSAAFASGQGAHARWGYSGAEGPEHWGDLETAYATCAQGKNQSPVNITQAVEGELAAIQPNYAATDSKEVLNNGHTIQVNMAPGGSVEIDGQKFELKQFHFHGPSENTIDGKSYPLEAHLVHADAQGNLAVIGIMFEEGPANAELEKAWAQMPEQADAKHDLPGIKVAGLLPAKLDYYRFNGSLTTPPCTEGVRWLVLKDAQTASAEQIAKFTAVMHHANNRPVQPINARVIVQ